MSIHGRTAATAVVVLVSLSGITTVGPASAAETSSIAVPATMAAGSTLDWQPCPQPTAPTKQCATLTVPRNYRRPGKGSFQMAVARIPATGPANQRIGSLFWNAGGPGGAGVVSMDQFSARLSARVRSRFDFVSWDPRGIGQTVPALIDCAAPWPVRPARTASPNWTKVRRATARALARANRKCQAENRSFINYMGTNNVVRDLDRLRQAVGDRKLTFWATSYGTRIGYVYALRYPNRVRAMLMDGSINPSGSFADLAKGGVGPDKALRFMHRHYRAGYRAIIKTAAALTQSPLPLDDGTLFSRWDFLDVVGGMIGFQKSWPDIVPLSGLVDTARGSDERARQVRLVLASFRSLPNGNEGSAFSVVNCLDYADRPSGRQQAAITRKNARAAPVFGGSFTVSYAVGCSGLDLRPDPIPTLDSVRNRRRVAPVPTALANATADAYTPMFWADVMQRALGQRPMIKYRGGEHVIWGAVASACVNSPLDRFMLRLREPSQATCPFVEP